MKITYCLPVFNEEVLISKSIDSLLAQEIPGEILIYDDGSTDWTNEVLKHYLPIINEHNAKLGWSNNEVGIFFNKKRKGAAYCRNYLNNLASGEIISVCDADEYYKFRCHVIKEAFTLDKDLDLLHCSLHLKDDVNPLAMYTQEAYSWNLKSKCPISHPTVSIKAEIAKKFKYYEQSIETDLYEFYLLDIGLSGAKIGGCQDPIMLKYENKSNRDMTKSKELKLEMYKKYNIDII